ncbi:DUF4235 domain-containing protein [Nocardioides sp. Iso805N]|uniref:DUF4235 domain-containing protein n=1 Tax=Nocardioides sp. Iso805N TaxID=1283287 RepID=UPI0003748BD0|nr:DUF4235 domain-containing protein [Nocardioides sp. Iso805N]
MATSTSAKILYRPWGLIASMLGGLIAGQIVQLIWRKAVPGDEDHPPKPLESDYGLGQVVAAALVQGAIFAAVRALIDRGGARLFERATGEWPGE